MFDITPQIIPPAIAIPGDETRRAQPVKGKKKSSRTATIVAIGAIIILSDGSKCQVVAYDKNGQPLCTPVEE